MEETNAGARGGDARPRIEGIKGTFELQAYGEGPERMAASSSMARRRL